MANCLYGVISYSWLLANDEGGSQKFVVLSIVLKESLPALQLKALPLESLLALIKYFLQYIVMH